MHIDRQQYLLFAAAIAAGCGGKDEPPPVVGPPEIVADIGDPTVDSDLPLVVEPGPAPTVTDSRPEPPSPTSEGVVAPVPFSSSGQCRASKVPPPVARGCNDDVGNPGDCSTVRLPGGCGSFRFICTKCESYKKHFKPRVAERAVSCVTALSQQQLHSGCDTYRCGDQALKGACLDASAQSACQSIARQCGAPLHECTQMLSGMNAAGRAEVAACAAKGCTYGLWSCIEGM